MIKKIQILDDKGNDLLNNVEMESLVSQMTKKVICDISKKRDEAFFNRLKELHINFDIEEEQGRRFKMFVREIEGNKETIYYNDHTINGKRIITYVTKQVPFDPEKFSIGYETTYY